MTNVALRHSYPSWCCPYCGEAVGWLGRFHMWLLGPGFHQCPSAGNPATREAHRLLLQYRDLFRPGIRVEVGRHCNDPFHPLKDLELWADLDNFCLTWTAIWKDGTQHRTSMTLAECMDHKAWYATYKARLVTISPEYAPLDEIVIAYDDSGWRP